MKTKRQTIHTSKNLKLTLNLKKNLNNMGANNFSGKAMCFLKKVGFCLAAALLFSVMVLLAWAAYNYVDGRSANRNAYAYAGGWYETWQYYHQEYHEGSVQTAGNGAYTEFEGKLGQNRIYYEKKYLNDYEGFYKTFFNYVNWTRTKTDSNTNASGVVEVWIVPGWQP